MANSKHPIKITKSFVDKADPQPGKDQTFFRDSQLKGFALRITAAGVKSFVVEKAIGNKVKRITIGKYNDALPVEKARKKAQILLGQIADGVNPLAEKQKSKIKKITLSDVMEDYKQSRKSLKPKTLYNYQIIINSTLSIWKNKPITEITKQHIEQHHSKLGEESGQAYANATMRVLRALFNFAISKYETENGLSLITDNPVKRLSQTRAWYRVDRRQTFIKSHELKAWYESVSSLNHETFRDYLLLIVFTGLRRQEAATLKWEQVDLIGKTLKIIETINNDTHTLPLSDFLIKLLTQRNAKRSNEYVFPAASQSGYIIEPRKHIAKIINDTGIQFTTHDLRRTFITVAESLDIPAYALKRLLNHRMQNDVTAGYIVSDVERLRKPMQLIADYLQEKMGLISVKKPTENNAINANEGTPNEQAA